MVEHEHDYSREWRDYELIGMGILTVVVWLIAMLPINSYFALSTTGVVSVFLSYTYVRNRQSLIRELKELHGISN